MLVLTRRVGESIRIRDEIIVTVRRVKGGRVQLAIEAPDDVVIDRSEVWQRKQEFAQSHCEHPDWELALR